MKAGMIGGIFLGLIEGLNIAMMKWFSKMDQVPQHDEMQVQLASVSGDEPTKDAVIKLLDEQVKLFSPIFLDFPPFLPGILAAFSGFLATGAAAGADGIAG